MLISINRLSFEEDLLLEVEGYYTGLTILKKIEYLYKIDSTEHVLIYEHETLIEATRTISDYGISEGESLRLENVVTYMGPKSFIIYCQLMYGTKKVKFHVLSSFSITTVKHILFGLTGVSIDFMNIIFMGKALENEKTIYDYNIQKENVLHMLICIRGS